MSSDHGPDRDVIAQASLGRPFCWCAVQVIPRNLRSKTETDHETHVRAPLTRYMIMQLSGGVLFFKAFL
jgi:hypothetical protein